MAEKKPQTFENHAKLVPLYHFVLFGFLVINLLWEGWSLLRHVAIHPMNAIMDFLLAAALLVIFFYVRVFPLRVQDRIIRLEMRLRLHEVLPEDLRARIPELRTGQLIGLRFASDGELPELVRQVLEERITDRKEIKRRIKDWQPDYCRL